MSESKSILQSSWYLYATEFFAGMAVMAVELGASRLLAPYFSSSQIVWTIIIGTIMIAMALGNIFGGRSADKDPNPDHLYKRILIAAVWIAAIPLFGKYIIIGITGLLVVTVSTNLLIWAAFLACMIVFVFPLFLLGTVTPSLVKYSVRNLEHNGKIVGNLGAFNTVGSIIGTFMPTFLTIPTVGTAVTFLIFSGILLVLSVAYFLAEGRKRALCLIGAVLFVIFAVFGNSDSFAFWENDLAYEGESVYNYLQVRDTKESTILSTNVLFGVQSIRMKTDKLTGMYYDVALAAPVMADLAKRESPSVLILGMGTGTFAAQCKEYFPDSFVEGVEIDEKITKLARSYFALSDEIPVHTYDGRAFLNVSKRRYDVIMVDAYQDITIPFQMSSTEFFSLVKSHLKPDGVLVVNMNMYTEDKDSINAYLADTIAGVFNHVATIDVEGSTNRELFACMHERPEKLLSRNTPSVQDDRLRMLALDLETRINRYQSGGYVFTDDKAPVELMGMRVIDSLIQNELSYYKDRFRKEGITTFLKEMQE